MILQPRVRLADEIVEVGSRGGDDHRLHAFGGRSRQRRADDGGLGDSGELVQHALDVFRKDVQALGRHDHFLLAPADVELSLVVERADVAGMEPAVLERGACLFRGVVVPARDVLAAHEDLAILGDSHLHAGDRLADGAPGRTQRMVQRDDGRRLGQAVSLNDDKPQAAPERLELRIERRGADDHRPELEPEHPVDAAVLPPALHPVHRDREVGRFGRDPQNVLSQHVQHLGHADQDRDAALANLPDDIFGRVGSA